MVHKYLVTLLLFTISLVSLGKADELTFVFELCRHGARAPLEEKFTKGYGVEPGMLTPSGMRQHYLIGAYLRRKYVEELGFLNSKYDQDELHVASTHIARTIQSARCHVFGMYPPESSENLLRPDELYKSLPLLTLSEDYVNGTLHSIPSKYEPIAVNNNEFKRDNIYATGSCPYLLDQIRKRQKDEELWGEFDEYFEERIYPKLAEYFNISVSNIRYHDAYMLGDALVSLQFEGLLEKDSFTDEEWKDVLRLQMPWLLYSVNSLGNRLMVSKLFNPILEFMLWKIGREYDERQTNPYKGTEKYIYYSTHDLMIANFLKFFRPEDFYVDNVKYASNFIFELYKRDDPEEGYYLKIFYNNRQVHFPGCTHADCDFDEFVQAYRDQGLNQYEVFEICNSSVKS